MPTMISKTVAQQAFDQFRRDVEAIATQFGLQIHKPRASWGASEIRFSVKLRGVAEDGEPATFKRDARALRLSEDCYGRTFDAAGEQFRVVDLSPHSWKRPIVAARVGDGKRFKFTRIQAGLLGSGANGS